MRPKTLHIVQSDAGFPHSVGRGVNTGQVAILLGVPVGFGVMPNLEEEI